MSKDYNLQANLSEELRFLVNCCKTDLNEKDIKFIYSFLNAQHLDLNALISLANQHGILPLVYKTLKNLSQGNDLNAIHLTLKAEILTELKAHYMSISQRNMLLTAELLKLDKLAKENNINLLPFKGPILSQILYGDISLRHFSDLDILIKKKDFRLMAEKMLHKGYEPLYPIETFHGDKVMFEMNNDCPFYDTKRGISVELHWDFFRKLALPTKKFTPWKDTRDITINQHTFQTLSHETHLLYHALHGSKHLWERLAWILDIDKFIRAVPNLDWYKVIDMAQNMGALKMFLLGPALARRYFNTPLPEMIEALCEQKKLDSYIEYVISELNRNDPTPEDSLTKLAKVIGLRDTIYYKTLTLLEFILRPGINERRTIILPDSFFWLYWLLRPFEMAFRFIFCRLMKLCDREKKS